MQVDEFWSLVEQARAGVSGDDPVGPSGSVIGAALTERLARLPAEHVVDFHRCYERVAARAHRWEVCAAAYVIWGRISDDSFSDFKAGLVGLGRDWFERVVADADTLADHPMVRGIAAGQVGRFAVAAEAIHYAACHAYERHSDDADGFWEALETRAGNIVDEEEPSTGDGWSGRFGDTDAARIPLRLPRLLALFSGRAAGNG